jgi:ABC-type cobalamin transport system permease subunit
VFSSPKLRPWEVRFPRSSFRVLVEEILKRDGAPMHSISPRRVARTGAAGIAPYLTIVMIATALLFMWAGLCAI